MHQKATPAIGAHTLYKLDNTLSCWGTAPISLFASSLLQDKGGNQCVSEPHSATFPGRFEYWFGLSQEATHCILRTAGPQSAGSREALPRGLGLTIAPIWPGCSAARALCQSVDCHSGTCMGDSSAAPLSTRDNDKCCTCKQGIPQAQQCPSPPLQENPHAATQTPSMNCHHGLVLDLAHLQVS